MVHHGAESLSAMALDEAMNERVRKILGDRADVTEKKMFSGTCSCSAATCSAP